MLSSLGLLLLFRFAVVDEAIIHWVKNFSFLNKVYVQYVHSLNGILTSLWKCIGLEESVTEAILHAAFVPFGDIKDVNIPLDNTTGQHRGFAFVEYEEKEDAETATDNMHNSEL